MRVESEAAHPCRVLGPVISFIESCCQSAEESGGLVSRLNCPNVFQIEQSQIGNKKGSVK